jgi:hypothetical protein
VRDADAKGPLTSLTVETFRDLFNDAARGCMNWTVASLGQNTTIEDVPVTTTPYVVPHCGEKRTEVRHQLAAGVPKSGTLSGAPMVVIDRYGSADYVVYAIWALVTFEGVYIESGMVNATAITGYLSGAQPASFLGAVSTVLGLVETVVHVVHTLVKELNVASFALVDTGGGRRSLVSEDSALDKAHAAAIHRMMSRYQASRALARASHAVKPKPGKAKPRKKSGRNTKPKKRLGK